ncbi:unnamed protein product [Urochloa decumbens]|uniref:C2 domain-containing protein n=1 Tax=Urochloa decumbens TaxID=240449 RepID=A0ABC9ASC6_9POAL
MADMLLHGTLDATIFEAKFNNQVIKFLDALIPRIDRVPTGLPQLYATVDLSRAREVDDDPTNPRWDESFRVYCAHATADVVFSVKARLPIDAALVGRAYLPVQDLLNNTKSSEPIDRWLDILDEGRKPLPNGPKIHIQARFTAVADDANWGRGDAHVPDALKPAIQLAVGRPYEQRRCWEDVYDAIAEAEHVVYVTGWSVVPEITLARDGGRRHPGGCETLGELLKRKAKEGVRVLMLVWDDPTSVLHLCIIQGQMATNDAKTLIYLKGSEDTPDHSLFRTLNAAHSNDFYQGNIPGADIATGGPRESWRDIHCKIEGPAAWDVLHNFEQRWRKQGGKDGLVHNVLSWPWKAQKDMLVDLRGMENVIRPQSSPAVIACNNEESWNVQVFRSADSSACDGFAKTPSEATNSGLVSGKDHVIERSIQDAYIHAIRRAKRFIYIDNQYFLGSSFGWKPDDVTPGNINALHLIPRELSLKIVSKIEAGEPFAVYVVVPMWPEGDPAGWTVQAILHWQRKTMEMMYGDIATALKAKGVDADPRDYLSFFCLGNRETKLERSMDGGRDTEIAMGAYQPAHLNANGQVARGQIHGFRMSLWYEHLAELKDEFKDPGSLNCVRMVNKMASELWQRYASEQVSDLHGHFSAALTTN